MPFHFLPFLPGDVLWRMVSVALLFWGLQRIVNSADMMKDGRFFLYALLVAIIESCITNVLF
ncbi:MAG TPA: hypothetical protein DCP92_20415 [Nitrospiraceae bacterium]|nr:hypothetical protein [Nitrospiraceae bacterium]